VSEKLLTTASIWGDRFIIAAIIQGAIIAGLTLLIVAISVIIFSRSKYNSIPLLIF